MLLVFSRLLYLLCVCVCVCVRVCERCTLWTEISSKESWKELRGVAKEKCLERLSEAAQSIVLETHAESMVKGDAAAFNNWTK